MPARKEHHVSVKEMGNQIVSYHRRGRHGTGRSVSMSQPALAEPYRLGGVACRRRNRNLRNLGLVYVTKLCRKTRIRTVAETLAFGRWRRR